jgi:hypothetical protein
MQSMLQHFDFMLEAFRPDCNGNFGSAVCTDGRVKVALYAKLKLGGTTAWGDMDIPLQHDQQPRLVTLQVPTAAALLLK